MTKKQHIDIKENVSLVDLLWIHPYVGIMAAFIQGYCYDHGIQFQYTSLIRSKAQNKAVGAVSSTHVDGRAADISIRNEFGWTPEHIKEVETLINGNRVFKNWGALNKKGESRPIVVHDAGNGPHIHLQIRRGL